MPELQSGSNPVSVHPLGALHSTSRPAEGFSASRSVSANGGAHIRSGLGGVQVKSHVTASTSAKSSSASVPLASSRDKMVEEKRHRNDVVVAPPNTKLSAKNWIAAYKENEDEELQYGPGIVNKLKSRYLSRTLREKPISERPSLRRAASLEDWLDKETPPTQGGAVDQADDILRKKATPTAPARPSSLTTTANPATRNYDLKKTRSAENCGLVSRRSVSVSDLYVAPPLPNMRGRTAQRNTPTSTTPSPVKSVIPPVKEEIVIIERSKPADPIKKPGTTPASAPLKTRRVLPTTTLYGVEDGELPPPDTVRQVKSIFEPDARRVGGSRRSQSAGPSTNRIPLSVARPINDDTRKPLKTTPTKASVPLSPKPSPLGPKPTVLPPKPVVSRPRPAQPPPPLPSTQQKNPAPTPPRTAAPLPVVALNPALVSASMPNPVSSPAPPLKPVPVPAPAPSPSSIPAPIPRERSNSSCSESEDETDLGKGKSSKKISRSALENIRKEGTSQLFNFGEKTSISQQQQQQIKQVGIIRPLTIDSVKTESLEKKVQPESHVSELIKPPPVATVTATTEKAPFSENKTQVCASSAKLETVKIIPADHSNVVQTTKLATKNNEVPSTTPTAKSPNETSNPNVKVAVNGVNNNATTTTNTKPKKRQQDQSTTTVFNFTERKQVPDHIQNDGVKRPIARYKRDDPGIVILVRPGGTTESSSDYIEDADEDVDFLRRPPSPCNVHFEGWNVVINGRSSLQRQPKLKKLNISFNDEMTMLFEYPSEISLLLDDDVTPNNSLVTTPSATGNLASYTPSKVVVGESFELGVSRMVSSAPKASPAPARPAPPVEDYLKPAEIETTWSAETTADLLF